MLVEIPAALMQVERRPEERRCTGDPVERVRRMLVVRNDRLGDAVLTLPAIRALRRTYPRAWIGLLVRRAVAGLASMADDVDEVVVDPGDRDGLLGALGGFRPDVTVCIARGFRVAMAARRLGLPNRVGTGFRPYSWIYHRRVDEHRRSGGLHEVEYALSFAHRLGAEPGPAEFPLTVPESIDESCGNWLAMHGIDGPFVVLHPGSGGSCPSWSVGNHVQLAALLAGHGVPVVFSVGPADEDVRAALDGEPRSIRRMPRWIGSTEALAALISRAGAVVASSTGPVHLAAALGTSTLAFHAPWRSCGVERWGPYSPKGWALVADLADARRWSKSRRERSGGSLLDALSPSTARSCVEALLAGRAPSLDPAPPEE